MVSWYEVYRVAQTVPSVARHVSQHKWVVPLNGWVKINVDGVTRLDEWCGGVGVVLQDERGLFIAAWRGGRNGLSRHCK